MSNEIKVFGGEYLDLSHCFKNIEYHNGKEWVPFGEEVSQ